MKTYYVIEVEFNSSKHRALVKTIREAQLHGMNVSDDSKGYPWEAAYRQIDQLMTWLKGEREKP